MGLAVIPFRVEAVAPRDSLAYFLATVHWLDATTPPLHKHLGPLTERVKRLLIEAGRSGTGTAESALEREIRPRRTTSSKRSLRIIAAALAGAVIAICAAVWFFAGQDRAAHQTAPDKSLAAGFAKSIAVLPFENIGANKDDAYFADGVQDEILNHLAKIAQLKVISRTSVMQYRADTKRNLRQIADALGVASVLEGAVRRAGNRIRVSTELIDARNDSTVWADSYDRDLTDIFAIQSEVAQTIADKLTATLSPEERKSIDAKPTSNLTAYDLYLRARQLFLNARISFTDVTFETPLYDAIRLLEQAVRLDPKFTLAYCAEAETHDFLFKINPNPERRTLADTAVQRALELQPDLSEAHLAFAQHLFYCYRDNAQARVQLAIAKRGLPNNVDAILLEAYIDRRQGNWEKAIEEFNEAIVRDPRNAIAINELASTLPAVSQFRAAEQAFDRLIELRPDQPMLKVQKALFVTFLKTGNDEAIRSAIARLPASMADDNGVLNLRLSFALVNRDWPLAKQLLEKMKGHEDEGYFAYVSESVPIGCYAILLARLQEENVGGDPEFTKVREQLSEKVQEAPEAAGRLSELAVVDALLNVKETAIAEAKHAIEILPISKDALAGAGLVTNLAVVYAWTDELDLAFATLEDAAKTPACISYGELKRDLYWEPLRKDPRYEKLLAELKLRDRD
ncbi:MAG TPA: hypothetical protein VFO40_27210, partial [Chthoniobacterales bacterium]|nr:hypothetical protein [Chthoniobacterales bacterium]